MTIYEIDNAITSLFDSETGELLNENAFIELQMQREEKLENLALYIKNLSAEAKAIKEEINNLEERQRVTENKARNAKNFLANILNGEKFKTPKVAISWRKSVSTKVDEGFVSWARENADDLLTFKEPEANKTAIKNAINEGRQIRFASLEEKKSMTIK